MSDSAPSDRRYANYVLGVLFLILDLIGLGLGPQVVGILNDLLAASAGVEAVRYSLLIVSLTSVWAALHFAIAARSLEDDIEAKNRQPG